jgi:hypothetical protein
VATWPSRSGRFVRLESSNQPRNTRLPFERQRLVNGLSRLAGEAGAGAREEATELARRCRCNARFDIVGTQSLSKKCKRVPAHRWTR